jgi:hypothetical protein
MCLRSGNQHSRHRSSWTPACDVVGGECVCIASDAARDQFGGLSPRDSVVAVREHQLRAVGLRGVQSFVQAVWCGSTGPRECCWFCPHESVTPRVQRGYCSHETHRTPEYWPARPSARREVPSELQ